MELNITYKFWDCWLDTNTYNKNMVYVLYEFNGILKLREFIWEKRNDN
jgi:hypothetical protein